MSGWTWGGSGGSSSGSSGWSWGGASSGGGSASSSGKPPTTNSAAGKALIAGESGQLLRGQALMKAAGSTTHEGGFGGFLNNALGDLGSAVYHLPGGIISSAEQVPHTLFSPSVLRMNVPIPFLDPSGTRFGSHQNVFHHHDNLIGGLGQSLVRGTAYDVGFGHQNAAGMATGWDWHPGEIGHREFKHPLNLPLDILSVLDQGGTAALRGVKAGAASGRFAEGSRLARLADDTGRTVTYGDRTLNLSRAKTLQGRMIENAADRFGGADTGRENWRLVGVGRKFQNIGQAGAKSRDLARWQLEQRFAREFNKLNPDEQALLHVGAQFRLPHPDHPLETPVEQAIRLVREDPGVDSAAKDTYIHQLESANPAVLEHPSKQMIKVNELGRQLRDETARVREQLGLATPEDHALRDLLPMRAVSGVKIGPSEKVDTYTAARKALADAKKETTKARGAVANARVGVARMTGRNPALRDLRIAAARMASHGGKSLEERYAEYTARVTRLKRTPVSQEEFAARGPGHLFEKAKAKHDEAVAALSETPQRYIESEQAFPHQLPEDAQGPQALPEDVLGRRIPENAKAQQKYEAAQQALREKKAAETAARKALRETPKPGPKEMTRLVGGTDPAELARMQQEWLSGQRDIPGLSREFGPAYRWPHTQFDTRSGAQAAARKDAVGLGKKPLPATAKFNQMKNLVAAHYETHPQALLYDHGQWMGYAHALDMQHELLEPHAIPIGPEGVRPGYRMFDPNGLSALAAKLRDQRQTLKTRFGTSEDATAAIAKEVTHPQHVEYATAERAGEKGLMQVPKWVADRYQREMHQANYGLRLIWDRPTDMWRYLTLNVRPGWAATNAVSNAMMMALQAGKEAPAAYMAALGDRNIKAAIEETDRLAGVNRGGLYRAESNIRNVGVLADRYEASRLARYADKGGSIGRWMFTPIRKFGSGVTRFNVAMENAARRGVFMEDAIPRMREFYKNAENANKSLEQALREIYGGNRAEAKFAAQQAVEHVDRALGNFTDLGRFEREWVRRFIPFYSWYKVAAIVSKNLVVDHPLRINLLLRATQAVAPQDQAFPDFLQGALQNLPGLSKNDILTTTSQNPFTTPVQTVRGLQALGPGGAGAGENSLLANANPIVQALYSGFSGTDPFTGGKNYSPGAKQGPLLASLGAFANQFPEVGYAQHIFGGLRVPGTNFAPIGKAYPSKLYPQQSRLDYLLNYLGVPIKHVNRQRAAQMAAEERLLAEGKIRKLGP